MRKRGNLFHVAPYEQMEEIYTVGIYPLKDIVKCESLQAEMKDEYKGKSLDDIAKIDPFINARKMLWEKFPDHLNSVFLWKDEPMEMYTIRGFPVEVVADKIPCKCKEANFKLATRLWKLYMKKSIGKNISQTRIERAERRYEDSVRPLDDIKNDYDTEVMCPCHIPVKAMIIPKLIRETLKINTTEISHFDPQI